MIHANAWGLPYAIIMTGAKAVFPGPHMDAESLLDLCESEQVTLAAGVPEVAVEVTARAVRGLELAPGRRVFLVVKVRSFVVYGAPYSSS